MLTKYSTFCIQDDSSAKKVKIFHIYTRQFAYPGVMVLVVVRREMYNKKSFKKRKLFSLLMTIKRKVRRPNGSYDYRFDFASGLLLAEDRKTFLGWYFSCPISIELKKSAYRELCQYSRKTF
jgi:ribosomal protein L14